MLGLSLVLVAGIAWLDNLTGPSIHFGVFYLVPVAISTWFGGRIQGLALALAAVLLWVVTDVSWTPDQHYSPAAHLWNTSARLAQLLLFSWLVGVVRVQIDELKRHAERDPLTGLRNRRAFLDALSVEHHRLVRFRHPFSLAYIDLDNFKAVNDRQGHAEGDRLLTTVAQVMRERTRSTDVAARLGGDEFAVLLGETSSEAAVAAVRELEAALRRGMERRNWPVTFSIGVVTFRGPARSVEETLHLADQLMYLTKRGCKDAIRHQEWDGGRLSPPRPVEKHP